MRDMTAIDLRASTMQILERLDKTDTSLWQKVLDAINSIYKSEEEAQQAKKVQQKAKIRQMVGILSEKSADSWKHEKEEALLDKCSQSVRHSVSRRASAAIKA